jgi:lipoprotein-releasing system permease protein
MRRLSLLFARRYLFSRKSHSVIGVISRVSAFAVGVPVAAMVILLSVFNGFDALVKSMFREFDPDIVVTAAEGKVFDPQSVEGKVLSFPGVERVSRVLEDNALLEYRGRQYIATIRGVDSLYGEVVPIEGMVVEGKYELRFGDMMQALVGQGVAYNLGVRTALYDPIKVFIPRRGNFSTLLPVDAYRTREIFPAGIFALDIDTDGQYVIAPLEFAEGLFDYPGKVSSLAVRTAQGADADKVASSLRKELGDEYKVLTRYQQKATMYRVMAYEKWGIFVIILLVMIIASFSVIGSLAMLIIDKRDDMRTMISLGGSVGFVRGIFVREGMMISLAGALGGMVFGLVLCWAQATFGLIPMPAETFLIDAYPVVVQPLDIVTVAVCFTAVSYIIAKFTVVRMIPRSDIRI